jgi:hypothetical protein
MRRIGFIDWEGRAGDIIAIALDGGQPRYRVGLNRFGTVHLTPRLAIKAGYEKALSDWQQEKVLSRAGIEWLLLVGPVCAGEVWEKLKVHLEGQPARPPTTVPVTLYDLPPGISIKYNSVEQMFAVSVSVSARDEIGKFTSLTSAVRNGVIAHRVLSKKSIDTPDWANVTPPPDWANVTPPPDC